MLSSMASRSSRRGVRIAMNCSSAFPRAAKNGAFFSRTLLRMKVPSPHPGKQTRYCARSYWSHAAARQRRRAPVEMDALICRRNIKKCWRIQLWRRDARRSGANGLGELPQQVRLGFAAGRSRQWCSRIPASRPSRQILLRGCRRARDDTHDPALKASRSTGGGLDAPAAHWCRTVSRGYSATVEATACLLASSPFELGLLGACAARGSITLSGSDSSALPIAVAGAADLRGARYLGRRFISPCLLLAVPIFSSPPASGSGSSAFSGGATKRRPFTPPPMMGPPPPVPSPPTDAGRTSHPQRTPAPTATKTSVRKRSGRPGPLPSDPSASQHRAPLSSGSFRAAAACPRVVWARRYWVHGAGKVSCAYFCCRPIRRELWVPADQLERNPREKSQSCTPLSRRYEALLRDACPNPITKTEVSTASPWRGARLGKLHRARRWDGVLRVQAEFSARVLSDHTGANPSSAWRRSPWVRWEDIDGDAAPVTPRPQPVATSGSRRSKLRLLPHPAFSRSFTALKSEQYLDRRGIFTVPLKAAMPATTA